MFVLHERLIADTSPVDEWNLSTVLLMNDANFPWLILVPRRPGLSDLHDLDETDRPVVMAEIARASRALQALFQPDKINVGALGNMVAQLHIHVIARHVGDPAWPGPAWGAVDAVPYDQAVLERIVEDLRQFPA